MSAPEPKQSSRVANSAVNPKRPVGQILLQ
jgi:hypothetical protein